MMETNDWQIKSPIVFISYSHDSEEHCQKVLALSNRFRKEGIRAIIDQYEDPPPEGWPQWTERQICNADFVILICTEAYHRRITGTEKTGEGLGVKWEGKLIYQLIYESDTHNDRFIPVIFEVSHRNYIPQPLTPYNYYILDSNDGYEALYRRLTKQPKIIKPELGELRTLPPIEQGNTPFPLGIASSKVKVTEANFSEKHRQFTPQINLDDPKLIRKSQDLLISKSRPHRKKSKPVTKPQRKPLTLPERKLLGLMAVSRLPLEPFLFKQLYPDIDWKKEIQKFIRQGLLEKEQKRVRLSKSIKKIILSDQEEVKSFHQKWIEVLKPLRYYSDIPIFLAPHYADLGELDEAIMVMVDVLIDMEPGWYNSFYLSIFKKIAKSTILRKVNPESRVNFYNCMGLCLSRNGEHSEAIEWYLKLRKYSKRIKHLWGIGQSYINCGTDYFDTNEIEKAEKCYRKAVEHGRATKDKWLLGRALHNLACTIYDKDMDQAIQLMNESLKIKESLEDQEGIIGALVGYGNLAMEQKKFKEALQWYLKAEKKSKKLGFTYLHSLALINAGSANAKLNNPHNSIGFYQKGRKIAESEGYKYPLTLAVKAEALARLDAEEFKKAELLFRELYNLKKMEGDSQEMLIALHDVGIMLIKQKKYREARKILGQTLKLARRNEEVFWIYRCHLANAASHVESGDTKKALQTLRKNAQQEEKTGLHIVSGQLWEQYIILIIANNEKANKIEQAFKRCIQCIESADDNYSHLSRIYKFLYQWRWDNNFFEEAIEALETFERLAGANKQLEDKIRASNQRGVCFQNLRKLRKAEEAYRHSLKLARRQQNRKCLLDPLNNLGELLREIHQFKESNNMFKEAEEIADEINDVEAQISIAHNRALTIREEGNILESEKIILQCRDIARKNKLWYEYVRAIRGLAKSAYIEGKNNLAERRYLAALTKAEMYEFHEYRNEIIFDYSDFLGKRKRFGEAIDILEKHRIQFENSINAPFYYRTLASLYENINDLEAAKRNWKKAGEAANLIDHQAITSECSEALERINRQEQDSPLTESELEQAIQAENEPEKKSKLMVRLMEILLYSDKEKKAESIFKKTLEMFRKNDLKDTYIALYLKFGDYLWQKSSLSQYKALQLYFIPMIDIIAAGNSCMEIGKHILDQLLTIEPKKRLNRANALYERLAVWIKKMYEKAKVDVSVDLILWPLKVSMHLPLICGDEILEYHKYKAIGEVAKRLTQSFK